MAIDTNNKKLAVMELDQAYEPGLPLSPGVFGQDDKQQLLWGYPGILWEEVIIPDVSLSVVKIGIASDSTGLITKEQITS